MKAIFIETSIFTSLLSDYLSDDEYAKLQQELLKKPEKGNVIKNSGGLRKIRVAQKKRGKGKRSGARVIYYWHLEDSRFLMLTIYHKDEMSDLSSDDRSFLRKILEVWRNEET